MAATIIREDTGRVWTSIPVRLCVPFSQKPMRSAWLLAAWSLREERTSCARIVLLETHLFGEAHHKLRRWLMVGVGKNARPVLGPAGEAELRPRISFKPRMCDLFATSSQYRIASECETLLHTSTMGGLTRSRRLGLWHHAD